MYGVALKIRYIISQALFQQGHKITNFLRGPIPVLAREQVKAGPPYSPREQPTCQLFHSFVTGAVPFQGRQALSFCPAAIAVHYNSYMNRCGHSIRALPPPTTIRAPAGK